MTPDAFSSRGGGGVTLTNLFRRWPVDRLANIHEDPTAGQSAVCRRTYVLGDAELPYVWPLSALPRRAARVEVREVGASLMGDVRGSVPAAYDSRARVAARRLAAGLTRALVGKDGSLPRSGKLSLALRKWIDSYEPELVYTFLGTLGQMRLVEEISAAFAAPVAVHMMDDWPAVLYSEGLLSPWLRPRALRLFRRILDGAAARLAISGQMAREYERRYGDTFAVFHNVIDGATWASRCRREWRVSDPARIVYAGSIVPSAQRQALHDVCRAAALLRRRGTRVQMAVYAPPDQAAYLRADSGLSDVLVFYPPPDDDALQEVLSRADVLVLPNNFDAASARYTRLSMPTKVPAYMASGTPILVFGPPDSAVARYATGGNWGYVHGIPDVTSLVPVLQQLLEDFALRERLGTRAHELALRDHDGERVRPLFWGVLERAARGHAHGYDSGT